LIVTEIQDHAMIGSPSSVIFDFDYTLADSSKGACACIDYALEALGLPAVSADVMTRTIGLSLPDTFVALAPDAGDHLAPEFAQHFLRRAGEVMADLTEIYEDVPDTLSVLRREGIHLAIVSGKYRSRIEAILLREGLDGAFSTIVAGDDVEEQKPDPTGLLAAIEYLGGKPASVLYVGDSIVDAETARRAGVPFIATLTGTTAQDEFSEYSVTAFIDHLGQLPSAISDRSSV
jgi:phosphoglycolate phosphatase